MWREEEGLRKTVHIIEVLDEVLDPVLERRIFLLKTGVWLVVVANKARLQG